MLTVRQPSSLTPKTPLRWGFVDEWRIAPGRCRRRGDHRNDVRLLSGARRLAGDFARTRDARQRQLVGKLRLDLHEPHPALGRAGDGRPGAPAPVAAEPDDFRQALVRSTDAGFAQRL